MSKKSRKRNKKILGALAAGLGAMALMKRRKTKALNAITAGDIVDTGTLSGKAGFEGDISSAAPGANKVIAAPVETTPYLSRMQGHGPNSGVTGQNIRANYAQRGRYVNPNEQTAAAGAAYVPRIPRVHARGVGLRMKSGGRVGCGKAKRGFGRALKKK